MTYEECLNRRDKTQEIYDRFSSVSNEKYIDNKTNVEITQEDVQLILLALRRSVGMEIYNMSSFNKNSTEEEYYADFTTQR